jgi:hypothetical protein
MQEIKLKQWVDVAPRKAAQWIGFAPSKLGQ